MGALVGGVPEGGKRLPAEALILARGATRTTPRRQVDRRAPRRIDMRRRRPAGRGAHL